MFRRLLETIMAKLHILHGVIMTISMNTFGLLHCLSKDFVWWSLAHWCAVFTIPFSFITYMYRSPACFELRWPMRRESPFLLLPEKGKRVSSTDHFWPKLFCLFKPFIFLSIFCKSTYWSFNFKPLRATLLGNINLLLCW